MFCNTEKIWHRGDTAKAVAPAAGVRGLGFWCTSVPGVRFAPRGFVVAPSLDGQSTH